MPSDSARSTRAAESRFRVQAPNAEPRNILVVALDPHSSLLFDLFRDMNWQGLAFAEFAAQGPACLYKSWRDAPADKIDVILMIASAGQSLDDAGEIGRFAQERAIKVSSVLLVGSAPAEAVSTALCLLRPWTRTLTVLNDTTCLAGLLQALGG